MKKVFYVKAFAIALFMVAQSNVFAQKKWGGMTLYTVRNEMGKDPHAEESRRHATGLRRVACRLRGNSTDD